MEDILFPPFHISCPQCGREIEGQVWVWESTPDREPLYAEWELEDPCSHFRGLAQGEIALEGLVEFYGGRPGYTVAPAPLSRYVQGWKNKHSFLPIGAKEEAMFWEEGEEEEN